MDALGILVLLLVILGIAGVIIYFVFEFRKHQTDNAGEFDTTQKKIDSERSDRLSNLKFVVDQVNDVNTDIYRTFSSNVGTVSSNISDIAVTQNRMSQGLSKFLRFGSNASITNSPPVSLVDLPGTSTPDVHLIQHVNAMMGLRVTDLGMNSNAALFCNPSQTRCIRFPDKDGNVLLTPFDDGKSVIVDAPMALQGDMRFMSSATATTGSTELASLSSVPGGGLIVATDKMAVGPKGFTNPTATLHLKSTTGMDVLKISGASDAVLVKADGEIVTSRPISFRANVNDPTNVATLSIQGGKLQVQTSELAVQGNLSVSGSVAIAGAATVSGKAVQTAA